MIPPHVTLPPIVGGRTSLNLFAALVGPSGSGKGGSESAAREAIEYTGLTVPEPLLELHPGSGEGIARTFQPFEAQTVHTALFTAPEVDTLSALMGRQGSTLEGELRKVYAGEALGFSNAQKHTRTQVPRLSYRAGLIVGVQPRRAAALLDGADGGTPQRFIWASVLDRDMPDEPPPSPDPLTITLPTFRSPMHGFCDLAVPDVARRAIDAHQLAMHRGDEGVDPLDGHALLTRLKVAAALMVLDARAEVNEGDWRLAGRIMLMSDVARVSVQREMSAKAGGDNRARAWAADERDEFASDRKLIRCKQGIVRWLDKLPEGQHLARRDLSPKLKAELRPYFDAAVAELVEDGAIIVVPLGKGTNGTAQYAFWAHYAQGCTWGDSPRFRNATLTDFRLGDTSAAAISYGNKLIEPDFVRTTGTMQVGGMNLYLSSYGTDSVVMSPRGTGQECGIWAEGGDNKIYNPHFSNDAVVAILDTSQKMGKPPSPTPSTAFHLRRRGAIQQPPQLVVRRRSPTRTFRQSTAGCRCGGRESPLTVMLGPSRPV
jgi:hypothetical protein